MSHSYTSFHAHFVWGTKYCSPLIQAPLKKPLYDYIGSIVKHESACTLIAAGGITNHIHLLVRFSAQCSPAALARRIKSLSSQFVHKKFPNVDFDWQAGYGGFAVSVSLVDTVKRYIERQEEHHKAYSFEKEFKGLIMKHNLVIEKSMYPFGVPVVSPSRSVHPQDVAEPGEFRE